MMYRLLLAAIVSYKTEESKTILLDLISKV